MRPILAVALAAVAGLGVSGCSAPQETVQTSGAVGMTIQNYQVIWARGGKLGYLRTYDVADAGRPGEKPVPIHYVLDLDLRTDRGWVSDNGLGERFEYPADRVRESYRAPFERVALPADSVENQIKRILGVDPGTEIALRPASPSDVAR